MCLMFICTMNCFGLISIDESWKREDIRGVKYITTILFLFFSILHTLNYTYLSVHSSPQQILSFSILPPTIWSYHSLQILSICSRSSSEAKDRLSGSTLLKTYWELKLILTTDFHMGKSSLVWESCNKLNSQSFKLRRSQV